MALLTAAHQHNSGAAALGDGASGTAAALASLAAALGGRQLVLSAPGGAADVTITAG